VDLQYLAVVTCDHVDEGEPCPASSEYIGSLSDYTLEQFRGAAMAHFRGLGWVCGANEADPNSCPAHAGKKSSA
jgi:hypothetical protein